MGEYRRHKQKKIIDDNLMTDRSAYISFLEIQLDKVSSACLTVQGFSERIQQLHDNTNRLEEQIQSLAHSVQLSTNIIDKKDAEISTIVEKMCIIEQENKKLHANMAVISNELPNFQAHVQERLNS